MVRADKVAAVDEIKQDLSDSAATLLTHYRGLSVTDLARLRAQLRESNATYKVVKNTLTRRALADAGMEGLIDLIDGPMALVYCDEDPVGPAKAMREFQREHPELVVRGGWLEGEVLDDQAAAKLADLASRDELLGQLVGLLHGALANFVRLLQAPIEQQARLIQALADAGKAGGEQPAPEATDAAAGQAEGEEGDEQPADEAPDAAAEPAEGDQAETDQAGDEQSDEQTES